MNFDLDDQQRAFQVAVGDFLLAEYPLRRVVEGFDETTPPELGAWRGLMQLGVGGLVVPEAYGGAGLQLLDLAAVAETAGRHAMPGPFFEHAAATYALILGGSDAQKARWLPKLATGEARATIAFAEGNGSWTPQGWTLPAQGRISGQRRWVPHAAGADLIVVGLEGGRLAMVEAGGFSAAPVEDLDAGRRLNDVTFDDAAPEPLDGGANLAERVRDVALILLAADAYGGASQCVSLTADYAKERVQFGVPIAQFQAVKHQLADMAVDIEPAVGLYWCAAHVFDHDPAAAPMAAALAKAHLSEAYVRVSRRAIELHGGIGYTWEYGMHVYLKRAVFDRTVMGQPAALRAQIAEMAEW